MLCTGQVFSNLHDYGDKKHLLPPEVVEQRNDRLWYNSCTKAKPSFRYSQYRYPYK